MRKSTFTRSVLVLWVIAIGIAAGVSVAIGVGASLDSGGDDAGTSASADEQATSTPRTTAAPAEAIPTPTAPEVDPGRIVFTGRGGKATETFHVEAKRFTVRWRTETDDPNAFFFLAVYREGEDFPLAEASFEGAGVDSTVVRAGPGDFYIEVITGMDWQIEVEFE